LFFTEKGVSNLLEKLKLGINGMKYWVRGLLSHSNLVDEVKKKAKIFIGISWNEILVLIDKENRKIIRSN